MDDYTSEDDDESQPLILTGPAESYDSLGAIKNNVRRQHIEGRLRIPHGEHTQAYEALKSKGLLITAFRKERFSGIFEDMDLEANSSRSGNFIKRWKWGVYWTPGCGLIVYNIFHKEVIVPPGHICCFINEDNEYIFAKPGVHNILDPFMKRVGGPISLNAGIGNRSNYIEHGNRTIVTVPQGMVGK